MSMSKKISWRNAIKNIYVFGILAAFVIIFALMSRKFLGVNNIRYIIQQAAPLVCVGVAATMLMIAGYIDLSVGSILAFSGVLMALMSRSGMAAWTAMIICVAIGIVLGFINGFFTVKLKITPVIATLATSNILLGISKLLCGDTIPYVKGVAADFSFWGRGKVGQIPVQVFFIAIAIVLFIILQKKSILGKYSVAIGGNHDAAVLAGINADRIVWILYVLVGVTGALAGCLKAANMGIADATCGAGFELDVIIAILMGGTSFAGGEGSVGRTIAGAFLLTVLGVGLNMANVKSFYQYVVKGLVLVLAVYLDKVIKEKISA